MSCKHILLTGCSCGGKSTLLKALNQLGYATVSEPGRRIIADETVMGGKALPWVDMRAFALRAVEMARSDLEAAHQYESVVFFDRGLIDAAIALEHSGGPSVRETLGQTRPYAEYVFVFPPWEELYTGDTERRHDFKAAVQEYHRINQALDDLGYRIKEMPLTTVSERADLIINECNAV
ncbi:MAG: AAA family ATPase [Paracoccaceae bacterium]|nr:AAA family ATPase [Paracoccaceae bacterium]